MHYEGRNGIRPDEWSQPKTNWDFRDAIGLVESMYIVYTSAYVYASNTYR